MIDTLKSGINRSNIIRKGQNIKKNAQFWLDVNVEKDTRPYVPYRMGGLSDSGQKSIPGSGIIVYSEPYAKYQFYGKVMAGKPRKPTEKDLIYHDKSRGPAGADWIERAKADHLNKWLDGLQRGLNTGNWTHGG